MKVLRKIQIVEQYQRTDHVHQLLCGINAAHPPLIPRVGSNGECELYCPEKGCSYSQILTDELLSQLQPMIDADPKNILKTV